MADIDYTLSGGTLGQLTFVYDPSGTDGATILSLNAQGQATTESGSGGIALSSLHTVGSNYEIGLVINQSNSGLDPVLLTNLQFYVNGNPNPVYSLSGNLGGADGVLLSDNINGAGASDYGLLIPTSLFSGGTTLTIVATIQDANGGPESFVVLTPTVTPNPEITVSKHTIEDGVTVDGGHVLVTEPISWEYTVTNTGNVVLAPPTLSDDDGGGTAFTPSPVVSGGFNVGDANHNGLLDPGETWQYTASGAAGSTTYTNTVTVTDGAAPQVQAQSSYIGVTPGITIDKQMSLTNGSGYADTTSGSPLIVLAGSTIYYQANVTNTTTNGLSETNVGVVDNPALTFTNGGDSTLTLPYNSEASFTASATALAGAHSDTATASGTVTDDGGQSAYPSAQSSAYYYGATAGITVDKKVSLDGTTYVDGAVANPLVVLKGFTVDFNAKVTNTTDGGLGATSVGVIDDTGLSFTGGSGSLASGGSTTFTASTTALAGSHTDTVTASESVTDGVNTVNPTAQDSVTYYGATAGITVDKQVSGTQGASKAWADTGVSATPTAAVILAAVTQNGSTSNLGNKVYYQALVQNTTDGGLQGTSVGVLDNTGLTFVGGATTLASGGSTTFTANATATTGAHTDTVTASETVTDGVNTVNPSAQDSAAYNGATAAITVIKQVSTDNGATWHNEGTGAAAIAVGQTVEFRVEVINNSTYGLAATGVSVSDVGSYVGSFKFGGNSTVDLAANGQSGYIQYSDVVSVTALLGLQSDTANASGTVSDAFGNSATPKATDTAYYTGNFTQSAQGLSAGYWYNHQNDTTWTSLSGGYLVLGSGGDTLKISATDAENIINSSTASKDVRQTLLGQAIAAELNILHGDKAPNGLMTDAVDWLKLAGVDKNNDGIISVTGSSKGGYSLEGTAMAASGAGSLWQTVTTYHLGSDTFLINPTTAAAATVNVTGEGLKNALEAFDQNQLVTDATGSVVAWNQSGAHNGPVTYPIDNSPQEFWAVLSAAVHDPASTHPLAAYLTANSQNLHGIA